MTLSSYNFTWRKEEKKEGDKIKGWEWEVLRVEKGIVFTSPRGRKLSFLMHVPFVREYQSDPHTHTEENTHRQLKLAVTHFRHNYSAECSKFVADTIFHAFNRETSQVEINKTCACSPEMLMRYSRRQCGEGWRVAFLLLAPITTRFLMFSIKLR